MTAAALPASLAAIAAHEKTRRDSTAHRALGAETAAKSGAKLGVESAARSGAKQAGANATDEALFAQAAGGNGSALETLIKRYEVSLYGLLVRMTQGDTHRAEDLFQESFLNAMRRAETFKPAMHFKPWITTIAVNLVRDDARKRKVRGEVALESSSDGDDGPRFDPAAQNEDPGHSAERRDDEAQIQASLGQLTEVEREVVLLHFYDGMTLAQTAETLEVPLGTVKSRLHAALTRLSGLLKRFGIES
jgi:RNA polymerase sigma-70 factor, ECF subfamily